MPATLAFWTISKLARALTTRTVAPSGSSRLAGRGADDLVDGVVPADVLADREQLAVRGGQAGRVHPTGAVEDRLPGPQGLGQPGQHRGARARRRRSATA